MSRKLDWAGLMRAGLVGLRLEPGAFWRLTPVELMLLLGLSRGAGAMRRARFEDLLRAFPDRAGGGGQGEGNG
jgi:uncharacterized phage protein (TIGR02216 family)